MDGMDNSSDKGASRANSEGSLVKAAAAAPAVRPPGYYGVGYPGQAEYEAGGGTSIDLLQYWRVLIKHRMMIGSIIAAALVLGTLRFLLLTPMYSSTIRLQIDRTTSKIVERGSLAQNEGGADNEFLKTQYELLQTRSMAERVASNLKLGDDPDFLGQAQSSIYSRAVALARGLSNSPPPKKVSEARAIELVLLNRTVRPVPGSRLVDVTFADPKPDRAKRVAAAFGEAFISSSLDKRFEANAYAKTFLEDQLKQLKLRLEDSEKAMLEFAQKEEIIVVNEKSSIAESNLAAANATLGILTSERIKNEQLWRQVEAATGINLPQLLTNSVIDGLRSKRNGLVTEYEEKLETFKPSYPAMVQIRNKIAETDRQLQVEVKTIKESLKGAFETSVSQELETKKRIDEYRADLLDLQKRSIQFNIVKREVDTNRSLYDGLLQRYKEVDVAGGVSANNIFIVDTAQVPTNPSSAGLARTLLLAFGIGMGFALASAFVMERMDDTVRAPDEVERLTGLATLGIIPALRSAQSMDAEFADPRSALWEAFRSLGTALQFSTDTGLPKTLFVTSSGPSEGKSVTSIAIARHFAQLGLKVLIIDADLRKPSLHTKLGLDNSIGLSNYLTGVCSPPEALLQTDYPNLAFMPSGPLPPNAADLLSSPRLLSLMSVGLEVFDLIVIDGPPVMGFADAPLVSSAASGTVLVVAAGQVRRGMIRDAVRRLQFARGHLVGCVMTKFNAASAGYGYGYGYSNGYGYGYGDGRMDAVNHAAGSGKAIPLKVEANG